MIWGSELVLRDGIAPPFDPAGDRIKGRYNH